MAAAFKLARRSSDLEIMSANEVLTLAISLLALVVSIVAAFLAYRQQNKELRTTIRDQLSGVIQNLIEAQQEIAVLGAIPSDQRDSLYSVKEG